MRANGERAQYEAEVDIVYAASRHIEIETNAKSIRTFRSLRIPLRIYNLINFDAIHKLQIVTITKKKCFHQIYLHSHTLAHIRPHVYGSARE